MAEAKKTIPAVKGGHPIKGHMDDYVNRPLEFFQEIFEEYGDIARFRAVHRSMVFLNHPDLIKVVLQENHRGFVKSPGYRRLKMLIGDGLFTSEGDHWLSQRRLAAPAFHKKRIEGYLDIMNGRVQEMIDDWDQRFGKQATVDLAPEMIDITLEVVTRCLINTQLNDMVKVIEEEIPYALDWMLKRVTSPINWPMWVPVKSNVKFKKSVDRLNGVIDTLIADRQKAGEDHDYGDLMSMFMSVRDEETGEGMKDEYIRDEILTMVLAGHETTAATMAWVLYQIAQNPEIEVKVREEIDQVLGGKELTFADFPKLTYTSMVLKECMRMLSPIWVIAREVKEDTDLNGYLVKKGETLLISPYLVHHRPDYWEDHDVFRPERFADNAEKNFPKFSYFPFGGGPRLCVGRDFAVMEMHVILTKIVQNYRFQVKEGFEPGYGFSLTLRPKEGMMMEMKRITTKEPAEA